MHSVSSLALHTGNSTNLVFYNDEKQNTYISLSNLFNLSLKNIRHNIVLKSFDSKDDYTSESKTILLIPEIECEIEISNEEIYPIPQTLRTTRFFELFNGMLFNTRSEASSNKSFLVLLLNAERLIQFIQKVKP
jgi:hypothetical protein